MKLLIFSVPDISAEDVTKTGRSAKAYIFLYFSAFSGERSHFVITMATFTFAASAIDMSLSIQNVFGVGETGANEIKSVSIFDTGGRIRKFFLSFTSSIA